MQRVLVASAGLALILTTAAHSQTPTAARLRAGAAKADFTPKESDLATATDSIRDHLYARAIVVDDGTTCAALVGLDLGSAANPIVTDAIARASGAVGCPAENFLVSATHTHSSNTHGLGQGAPTARRSRTPLSRPSRRPNHGSRPRGSDTARPPST